MLKNRLILILLGLVFNHAFAVDLGFMFLMPLELSYIISLIITISHPSDNKTLNVERLSGAIYFLVLLSFTIISYVNSYMSHLEVIRRSIINLGVISIFFSFNNNEIEQFLSFTRRFFKVLLIALFSIVILEFIFGAPLLKIGLIDVYGQSYAFFGLHNERLFLSELLALSFVSLESKKTWVKLFVFLSILSISIINQTFSGVLVILLVFIFTNRGTFRAFIISAILFGALASLAWNYRELLLSGIQLVNFDAKILKYTTAYETSFRYITNQMIWSEFTSKWPLFGRGMGYNGFLIRDFLGQSKTEESHSVISYLVDFGLIGSLSFLLYYFYVLRLLIRNRTSARDFRYRLAISFFIIATIRFLFYYHVTIFPYYFIPVLLMSKRLQSA